MEMALEEFRKNFHQSERSVLTKITLRVLQRLKPSSQMDGYAAINGRSSTDPAVQTFPGFERSRASSSFYCRALLGPDSRGRPSPTKTRGGAVPQAFLPSWRSI